MPRYHAVIRTPADPESAFAYLSRFDSAAEWDPGVASATMSTTEPVRLGSRFRLLARFAGRTIPLEYEIVDFDPNRRVILRAENSFIRSTDTITFEAEGSGTRVVYDALLEPKRARWLADPLLQRSFRRIGDRAAAGLTRALTAATSA